MSRHRGRLLRLERARAAAPGLEARCQPTVTLCWRRGRPRPDPPPDAKRCPACGLVHPRFIVERVIATREEYREALAELRAQERPGWPTPGGKAATKGGRPRT